MSNNDICLSPAAPRTIKGRRNRCPREPDAAAPLSGGSATSGPGSFHPHLRPSSLRPLAPRGHGQGQSQHRPNGGGSGLHQTFRDNYHHSTYEGLDGNGNGNGGGGGGAPSAVAYASEMAAAVADLRGDRCDLVNGPSDGPASQGHGFPAAHSNGCGPTPGGPGHPGWYGQHGPAGVGGGRGSQQGAGGSGAAPDGGFVVALGWGRSPYGS